MLFYMRFDVMWVPVFGGAIAYWLLLRGWVGAGGSHSSRFMPTEAWKRSEGES